MTKNQKKSPESMQYDKLKGQMIKLYLAGCWEKDPYIGRLIWVDRYTLGVQFGDDETISMVYKQDGMMIEPK